jgi:hypothetical protein
MVKSHGQYSRRLVQAYGQFLSKTAINLRFSKRRSFYLLTGRISVSNNFYPRNNLDAFVGRDWMLHNEKHRLGQCVLGFSTRYILANRDVFFACPLVSKCLEQPA